MALISVSDMNLFKNSNKVKKMLSLGSESFSKSIRLMSSSDSTQEVNYCWEGFRVFAAESAMENVLNEEIFFI